MNAIADLKTAKTQFAVHPLLQKRWSARSFSERAISQQELSTILEAASWAASASNEQPWLYYYAFRGSEGFEKIFSSLAAGNQPWAGNAAVLIAAVARKTFEANQKENAWAAHDLGMANTQLLLQAVSMDIYGHAMGGFDAAKLVANLALPEAQLPVCVIALGYLDDAEKLGEPFKSRELAPRTRKPLEVISISL